MGGSCGREEDRTGQNSVAGSLWTPLNMGNSVLMGLLQNAEVREDASLGSEHLGVMVIKTLMTTVCEWYDM